MCLPYLSNKSSEEIDSNRFSAFVNTSSTFSLVVRACLFRDDPREWYALDDEVLQLDELSAGVDEFSVCSG